MSSGGVWRLAVYRDPDPKLVGVVGGDVASAAVAGVGYGFVAHGRGLLFGGGRAPGGDEWGGGGEGKGIAQPLSRPERRMRRVVDPIAADNGTAL